MARNWSANFITAVDVTRHRGNADKVRFQIEINGFDILIGQHHLILIAWDRGGHRQQSGKRRIERTIHVQRTGRQGIGLRIDEMNDARLHVVILPGGSPPRCNDMVAMKVPRSAESISRRECGIFVEIGLRV
jgi:hypothetical protein